jgi:uncharacterized protein (TIGR03083 family)
MREWSYPAYCAAIEERTERFGATTAGSELPAPVPTCPGWTVADLVRHHGTSQRRVSVVLRTRSREPVYSRDLGVAWPADPAEVTAWYDAGRAELVAVLRETDPRTAVWTNGPRSDAGYWARRILHEAVIHGVDADVATGSPVDLPLGLAVDGIDELLDTVGSQPAVVKRLRELERGGQAFDLVATDGPDQETSVWRIQLQDSTFTWSTQPRGESVEARLSASAADLLLLLYGRSVAVTGRFDATGDRSLVDDWLAAVRW